MFAALMMGISLALTHARSYGVVDDIDLGRRSTGVLTGAFLVMLGNVMPKTLPPLSSRRCDGARQQAFQRLALGNSCAFVDPAKPNRPQD